MGKIIIKYQNRLKFIYSFIKYRYLISLSLIFNTIFVRVINIKIAPV